MQVASALHPLRLLFGTRGGPLDPAIVQKRVRDLRTQLGLADSVTSDTLRHFFATHLLGVGVDLQMIQEL
jgi:integrase/recombinase XerC